MRWLLAYGTEGVGARLLGRISVGLAWEGGVQAALIPMGWEAFLRGCESADLLERLALSFSGLSGELLRLRKACADTGVSTAALDRRVIRQVLYSGAVTSEHGQIIISAGRKLEEAFLPSVAQYADFAFSNGISMGNRMTDLIAGLIEGGMTQAEIAAETGRGEKWVARRANLRKLSKSWRKRVEAGEQFTVDCLEHVAAYPEEMQERLKDARGYSYYYGGTPETITWQQISSRFRNASRDLKSAAFNTAGCLGCLNNTGCCPDLFDQDGGKNAKLGRCLCDRCWRDKQEAHVSETVSKAEKMGVKIIRKKPKWEYSATDRKTKANTALYVYKDGDQMVAKWYQPPEIGEKKAKSKEEKREEREAKRREALLLTAKDEACDKFTDWADEHAEAGDWPKWFVDAAVEDMVREIRDYGAGDLEAAVDAFAANTGFTASDAEADKLYKEYLAQRAEAKAAKAKAADTTDSEVPDEAEL